MQTKSKLKSKKTVEDAQSFKNGLNNAQNQNAFDEFVQCGAICNDGTYTHVNGRGAGSRHQGVKHKLYAKKSDLEGTQRLLSSKASLSTGASNGQSLKCERVDSGQTKNQSPSSNSYKKKVQKKISLKQLFKTKAKRSDIFDNVQNIFDKLYKDQLEFCLQQIDDQQWLLFASVSSLYDELQQATQMIKQLQKPVSMPSDNNDKYSREVQAFLRPDTDALKKENTSLNKDVQRLLKQNAKLQESLDKYKFKQKNFKIMLKIIERSYPQTLTQALEESKINIKDLKSLSKKQSGVVTRSMAKTNSKKQEKQKESMFSSDESYDQDHTIRNIIKAMK